MIEANRLAPHPNPLPPSDRKRGEGAPLVFGTPTMRVSLVDATPVSLIKIESDHSHP
jgi:hypothetical protein